MADFLSTIAGMFRKNNGNKILEKARNKTYKPYTSEETAKIQAISRLPLYMQTQAYKSDKKLAQRVATLTPKALEARPFVSGAMNVTGQDLIKKLETATGEKLDTKKVQDSALWKAGSLAGEVANFALSGGAAGGAVAGLVTKGKQLGTLAKLGATITGDVAASTPYNLTQAATTAIGTKNPEKEFAKNFAINTALDVGIGGAIGVVPVIVRALKKVPETKVIGEALEKGNAIKDATEAEVKVQQAVKNLTQRKLKADKTIVQPLPESQMVTPQVSTTTLPTTPVPSTVVQPKAPKQSFAKYASMPNPELLAKSPVEKKVNVLKEFIDDARLRGVDTFTPQEDYARSLAANNFGESKRLLGVINKARNAREIARNFITNAQVNFDGTLKTGDSLTSVMDRIPTDKDELFQEFTFLKHHIDRLSKGKPILNLNKDDTLQRINDIMNSLSSEEKQLFNETSLAIRKYIDNLRQYGVDAGLITQKQIDLFENMYPNYIKTARYKGNNTINIANGNPKLKQIVNKASRSDDPILPLRSQLEILTNDYVVTGNYNNMIRELAKSRNLVGKGAKQKVGSSLSVTNQLGSDGERNFMTFYDNGREYKMPVSKLEAKSYKILTQGGFGTEGTEKIVGDILTPINTWFKLPITGVNPIFMVKNFMRDFEDALFYTQDVKGFLKNYPQAYKELKEKGDFFNLYQASGGKYSTFSYLDKDLKDKRTWFTRNISQRIEDVNSYVEQIPRMTEFINVLKKELNGNPLDTVTGDMINKASLAASEITTNFGRSGDVGKYLNRTGVPFLNPSIQGGSRIIRQLTGQDGFKGYMRLASKAAILGVAPAVLNEMIYGDDPEYQAFNDRDKEISFIFKVGNTWIKIPKGRLLSAMGMIPQGLVGQLKGDEYDFAELFNVMGGQIGPVNPLESNLFTPLIQAATNKTWYGGEIDTQQWDDVKKSERYDSTTSAIGKFLGSLGISTFGDTTINLSPRQWDYVIDGYTGIFGDTILPLLREDKTRRNPLKQAFTLDPVFQNDLSKNFYDLYDKTTILGKEPTQEELLSKRFMDRYKAKADNLLSQIREVQNEDITDEQKQAEILELRTQLNNVYSNAEFELAEFQSFLNDSLVKYEDEQTGYEDAVIQAQIKTGADEWEAYTMFMQGNKKENYSVAKNVGISPQSYYELFDGRLDVDGSGGVNQEEAQAVLDSMDFTNNQKSVLWNLIGSNWKSNPYTGTTTSGSKRSRTSSVASAYRSGLATKQVQALENLTVQSPNLTTAEVKAIIKMLSA